MGGELTLPDGDGKSDLWTLLSGALDSLAPGIVIIANRARILYANKAAREMLAAKSPIIAIGGELAASQHETTKELRRAIAASRSRLPNGHAAGVGVPLADGVTGAFTAYALPLPCGAYPSGEAPTAIFVMRGGRAAPLDLSAVAGLFRLTPAEVRLLRYLVSGASLGEAAAALGIAEATARTHRNHIFIKTGVSRRSELQYLVCNLLPPVRPLH
jgi:DNA-binding CsgD family transcriptional regulator